MSLENASVDDLRPFFESPDVARRGDYLTCLKAWFEHFPQERLWTGFMEDVAAGDESEVLRGVFEFLNVDVSVVIDQTEAKKVVNPRPPVPKPDGLVEYLQEILYAQNEELSRLLGRPVPWEYSI